MMKKALVLLSGGLDSMLAAKMLQEQGIEVTGLSFVSCFFNANKAKVSANKLKIKLIKANISRQHLALVKSPPHGYGKAANPCVDCHSLMLAKAKEIMDKEKYGFVATGEVLGQRPFSQNYKSLLTVQALSGLKGRLVRPLSAKLLPISLPEKKGWLDRSKLGDIQGRGRYKQIELAQKYGIKDYAQPAGGCRLTESSFAAKLFRLLRQWPHSDIQDIGLIYLGRHYWQDDTLIVLGRNEADNKALVKAAGKGDALVEPEFIGPSALIRGKNIGKNKIKYAQDLIAKASKKKPKMLSYKMIMPS